MYCNSSLALRKNVGETGSFRDGETGSFSKLNASTTSFNSNKGGAAGTSFGAAATTSFGSTATDFDNITCPGAQAELDEAYLRACGIGGGAVGMPAAGFHPTMPFGV